MADSYHLAQQALADLKAAIHQTLGKVPGSGLTNAEIGRTLGIYTGHVGHEGHIPRTLLAMMEAEGVVTQDSKNKRWTLKRYHLESELGGEDVPDDSRKS